MSMKPRRCGACRIDAIEEHTGLFRHPLELFPDATVELVDRHRDWLEPDCLDPESGRTILAFQSYLLRTERYTILVDSCVGEDKDRPLRPEWNRQKWPWLANLKAAGVAPEEVDFVLCTHLHVDHVGWNTRLENGRWVPTFPNATYLFGETEYRYWEEAHKTQEFIRETFIDSVLPVMEAGKAKLVASDFEIDTGVALEPSPGHTPGHVCLNVASNGESAVFCGDLMHHAIQVPEPQLSSLFCTDPAMSRETRTRFVDRYAETDTVIMPTHFPGKSAGHIREAGGTRRFVFCD